MLLSLSLCWLATGAWLLADARRLQRLSALKLSAQRALALRALGGALLLLAAPPLVSREGLALGCVALLLVLMATLSVAVLLFPLRPRWYAASLGLAALLGAVAAAS